MLRATPEEHIWFLGTKSQLRGPGSEQYSNSHIRLQAMQQVNHSLTVNQGLTVRRRTWANLLNLKSSLLYGIANASHVPSAVVQQGHLFCIVCHYPQPCLQLNAPAFRLHETERGPQSRTKPRQFEFNCGDLVADSFRIMHLECVGERTAEDACGGDLQTWTAASAGARIVYVSLAAPANHNAAKRTIPLNSE